MNNTNMNRREFLMWIREELKQRHPDWEIDEREIQKMQGLSYMGLSVRRKNDFGITVNQENLYRWYREAGEEDCLQKVEKLVQEHRDIASYLDLNRVYEYAYACTLLRVRLLPQKGNEVLLAKVPHRCVEDLAAVYYLETPGSGGCVLSLLVSRDMFEHFGIDEETLYRDAVENTARRYPVRLEKIEYWMGEELRRKREGKEESPLWLATSEDERYGAAVLLYPGFLRAVRERLDGPFFILPSSIHEVIFLKQEEDADPRKLQQMVENINRNDVPEEDILSYRIYASDGEKIRTVGRSYDA